MTTRYKLLAMDVDGTLVGPDSIVPAEVVAAVGRAQRAGMRVCLATGRSYVETIGPWNQLGLAGPWEPMVVAGGALVSEPTTGRTLYHKPIPREPAQQFAAALIEAGMAPMAIVDVWRHGVDYLLVEGGDMHEAQAKWFAKMNVRIRRVKRLDDPADLPPPLRISAVTEPEAGHRLAARLIERFGEQLNVHAILAPNYGVTIVEALAKAATKLSGLTYVAQAHLIPSSAIVAVGDDINDLAMVRGSGLGVAMGHGSPILQAQARHVAQAGLATFIDEMLAGQHD